MEPMTSVAWIHSAVVSADNAKFLLSRSTVTREQVRKAMTMLRSALTSCERAIEEPYKGGGEYGAAPAWGSVRREPPA